MQKIDKDALIKNKFWVLLGVFALLWIICLSFVVVNAGGPIDEAAKNYKDADAAVKKYPRPKNASFLPPWVKYGETFTKHKMEVWKKAWDGDSASEGEAANGNTAWPGQAKMYTWPEDGAHPLNSMLPYPDSDFPLSMRDWYKTKDAYGKQFADVLRELQPEGNAPLVKGKPPSGRLGAVVFKGGYDNIMKPLDLESGRTPDTEECWLAQEDFWVKRELLYVVADAVKMAARLGPVADAKLTTDAKPSVDAKEEAPAKDAKVKDDAVAQQVFRNSSWEVTLRFDRDKNKKWRISPDSRIKNIHVSHRQQSLGNANIDGVFFQLTQGGREEAPVNFFFTGQKLPWDKESSLGSDKEFPLLSSIDPKYPVELRQMFDLGNTPIASIDEIRIPYVSDRNANLTLSPTKPDRYGKKEAPAADATKVGGLPTGSPGGSPGFGGSGNAAPFGIQPGGSGPGGGGQQNGASTGAQPSNDPTPNISLNRDRYVYVSPQSRHLPLALTLTVDQSNMSQILVALANSRLRFQTTQVEFRRQPAGASAATAMGGAPMPGGSGPIRPMPLPSADFGPRNAGAGGVTPMAAPSLENPNLVELTIYGIASLYEHPRDDKK